MNGSVFSKSRYMTEVGFEILARTPVPQLFPRHTPTRRDGGYGFDTESEVISEICCVVLFCFSSSSSSPLTLKAPRKTASENVVCSCRLLNILANFSNLFLHTGKQCGPRSDCSKGAVWSGSTLFAKMTFIPQADDKADDNSCDWRFKG